MKLTKINCRNLHNGLRFDLALVLCKHKIYNDSIKAWDAIEAGKVLLIGEGDEAYLKGKNWKLDINR